MKPGSSKPNNEQNGAKTMCTKKNKRLHPYRPALLAPCRTCRTHPTPFQWNTSAPSQSMQAPFVAFSQAANAVPSSTMLAYCKPQPTAVRILGPRAPPARPGLQAGRWTVLDTRKANRRLERARGPGANNKKRQQTCVVPAASIWAMSSSAAHTL